MHLADGPRHALATGLAIAGFLGLFFGAGLVWWLALALAAALYGAALLVVRRRPALGEIMLADRVSAADLDAAGRALGEAARRLEAAAARAPAGDRDDLAAIAAHVASIRGRVLADAEDYRRTRHFISHHLPKMVATVETYVRLAAEAGGDAAARLHDLGHRIRGFGAVVEKIDRACLENDFAALEAEVDALGVQMSRV